LGTQECTVWTEEGCLKTNEPRLEQIAELTRGVKLPLPALDEDDLLIIIETLAKVWTEFLNHSAIKLKSEAEITALIETHLNNSDFRKKERLWETLVSAAIRGREMLSFDGSHLEKRPDLSLILTNNQACFPLIIECKLIDKQDKKTVQLYCHKEKGLGRFTNGDYAWYDQQAIMLAYVRDDSTITNYLTPHLLKQQKSKADFLCTQKLPEAYDSDEIDSDLACSQHQRTFRYPLQQQDEPGIIDIWHLWLSFAPSCQRSARHEQPALCAYKAQSTP